MTQINKIIFFGSNYSLIFAAKYAQSNIKIDIVCNDYEKKNKDKYKIKYYLDDNITLKTIEIKKLKNINFITESNELSSSYFIAYLGMPEFVYDEPRIKEILKILVKKKIPMISLMNLPPYQYLKKINFFIDMKKTYNKNFLMNIPSKNLTHASTEPQIKRKKNIIFLNHAGTLRISKFSSKKNNLALNEAISSFNSITKNSIPLKIKIYDSLWVSLNKLPMLMTGNYRCFDGKKYYSIRKAVNNNKTLSKKIYDLVVQCLILTGAKKNNFIPFNIYLKSTKTLNQISSVARNVKNKINIERVDVLVSQILFKLKIRDKNIFRICKIYDKYQKI
jgi:hypothetical protein